MKTNRKLRKGWFWSYIFSPMGIKKKWSACAVKPTGEFDKISRNAIYKEVFALGTTEEDAIKKVRELIKKEKWKIRPIYFPED